MRSIPPATPLACLLLLTAALAAPRAADAQIRASLAIAAGATAPVEGYASDKHLGWNAGLLLALRRRSLPVSLRVDGVYHELPYAHSSTRAQIWSATANLVLALPLEARATPYAIGGVGIYNSRRNIILANNSSTNVGFSVGGGLRFDHAEVPLFLEARYQRAGGAPSDLRILPIILGIGF